MKVIKIVRVKNETDTINEKKKINHRAIPTKNAVKGQTLKEKARFMRDNPSPVEKMLYQRLDDLDIRYRPQIVIGSRIVDVVLENKMVIMELDTPSYQYSKTTDISNMKRSAKMRALGFQVIRVPSDQIYSFDLSVLDGIPNCSNTEVGYAIHKTRTKGVGSSRKMGRKQYTEKKPKRPRPRRASSPDNLTEQFFFATDGI